MARKTLLTESEIRRFMKLASMPALGAQRARTLSEQPELEGGEEEMGMDVEEEMPEDEPMDDEMAMDDEMGMEDDEMGMEDEGAEELAPEAIDAVETALETMLDSMGKALEPYGVVMDAERRETRKKLKILVWKKSP